MKRIALIAASSIVVLSGTFALAQPQPIPPAGGDRKSEQTESREQRRDDWRQQRGERMKARLDERLGRVREELKLKPEQVAAWDRLEALIRQRSTEGGNRWEQMRDMRERLRHADLMERIDARAQRLGDRAAHAKELADAVRPLWSTLSDEQKTVLRKSVREAMSQGRERMREMRAWHGRWDRGDHDRDHGSRRWRDDRHDDRRGGQDGQDGQGRFGGDDDE